MHAVFSEDHQHIIESLTSEDVQLLGLQNCETSIMGPAHKLSRLKVKIGCECGGKGDNMILAPRSDLDQKLGTDMLSLSLLGIT